MQISSKSENKQMNTFKRVKYMVMYMLLLPIMLFGIFLLMTYILRANDDIDKKHEIIYTQVTSELEKQFLDLRGIYADALEDEAVKTFMTQKFEQFVTREELQFARDIKGFIWDSMNASDIVSEVAIYSITNRRTIANKDGGPLDRYYPEWLDKSKKGTGRNQLYSDGDYIIMVRKIEKNGVLLGFMMLKIAKVHIDEVLKLKQYDSNVSVRLGYVNGEELYLRGCVGDKATKSVLESMMPVQYSFYIDNAEKIAVILKAIVFSIIYIAVVVSVVYSISKKCATYLIKSIGTVISEVGEEQEGVAARMSKNIISEMGVDGDVEAELAKSLNKLHRAQLTALQMQMNPHFLFNTLSSVNVLVLQEDVSNEEVAEMVDLLADILEYAMSEPKYCAKVAREIEMVRKYIEIERAEVRKDFDVDWDVEESTLNRDCIKLFLQPIVENAIAHGIKRLENKRGKIQISVKSDGEDTIFTVQDNGRGIDKEHLEKLQNQLKEPYDDYSRHVGLRNVNERVKMIYGVNYGVTIDSDSYGTTVTVRIGMSNGGGSDNNGRAPSAIDK